MSMNDLIIVGFGPAGYTGSIYASRYALKHIVIGKQIGGQAGEAHLIENYPGFSKIAGFDLVQRMRQHALGFGMQEVFDEVVNISKDDPTGLFIVKTAQNKEYQAKAVLLAIGTEKRKLNVPGEKEFYGKGVTYCATCDGPFYKDKVVGVVGGGDAANTSSLYLAEIASKVYQFVRRDVLRGEPVWHERLKKNSKVNIMFNTQVVEILGDDKLKAVKLNTGETLGLEGLFIEIGSVPKTDLVAKLNVKTDEKGYIVVDAAQQTSIPGLFAAGDVTTGSNKFRQIATAVGEAAVAANSILEYIQKHH